MGEGERERKHGIHIVCVDEREREKVVERDTEKKREGGGKSKNFFHGLFLTSYLPRALPNF